RTGSDRLRSGRPVPGMRTLFFASSATRVGLCGATLLASSLACTGGHNNTNSSTPSQSAAEATGRDECDASPLVVDWRAEARGDLEVAMREGLAVVRYD